MAGRESEIKRKHKAFLSRKGWFIIHLMQTNRNGITDTLALKKGRAVFIEYKSPGEKPDPLQEYRIEQLRDLGFAVFVVSSSSSFIEP